jgi:hypothetical protein
LEDPLLARLWFRERARSFVRDSLGLYSELFYEGDTARVVFYFPEDLRLQARDYTSLQHVPNLEARTLQRYRVYKDVILGPRISEPYELYLQRLTARTARRLWKEEFRRSKGKTAVPGAGKGIVTVDLPVAIPKPLSPIFGKGKPNLSVRGSERITLGGTSQWHPDRPETEFLRRESKFPQLDMKQELNLKLSGSIGDKVKVDVDQSSQAATPLENRIRIHYTGYEDEIVQKVDLGNTSLNLPGTRYVSYGGRHQGLFGINAKAKLAQVDVSLILSKQEGETATKTVTKTSETVRITINDLDYQANQYFFLADPEVDHRPDPEHPSPLDPPAIDPTSIFVYIDDRDVTNNQDMGSIPGIVTLDGSYDPDDTTQAVYEGFFDLQRLGEDYFIQTDLYFGHTVLILNQPLDDNMVLAVTYVDSLLGPVGGFRNDTLVAKMIRPAMTEVDPFDLTSGPWAPTARLEMKNIYWLRGRGIQEGSLQIRIRLRGTSSEGTTDPWVQGNFTYLQILGLDLLEQTGESTWEPSLKGDDIVDPQWVDAEGGFLIFPTLRPFDPSRADSIRFRALVEQQGVDPDSLPPLDPDDRNSDIYDRKEYPEGRLQYSKFYLDVTYKSPVTTLRIDAFNIIEGSEVITAGGRTLVRDRDYRIDYVTGEIEILPAANISENDEIKVTYSTIPFGGGADKSLFGISAQYRPEGSPLTLSTSWLFDSQGSQDRRPSLGQEPRRTAIGELAMSYRSEPWFLTSLVDALPGVDARARSQLNVEAGFGVSLPNPNTKGLLYLDDFDGAQDLLDISLNRAYWRPSGIPWGVEGLDETERAGKKGEVWFYTPRNAVQEGDLQPTLSPTEADDNRTILELKFFPFGLTPEERESSWASLVQSLSRRDIDLSQAQFLDVWVNDGRQYRPGVDPSTYRRGVLHIDLGIINEDAIWERRDPRSEAYRMATDSLRAKPPNFKLDTEDVDLDGELDLAQGVGEDTGLDGIPDGQPGDHPFDNYAFDEDLPQDDPEKFAYVNGTEGNGRLDTEDLNGNGVLDQKDAYFEFTIPLDDTSLVETDVFRDFGATHDIDEDNAWRRIRIPINGAFLDTVGPAAWNKIQHVRIWIEGFPDTTVTLQIGGIQVSGNRWLDAGVRDSTGRSLDEEELQAQGEDFFPGVLNNKEHTDVYSPPFKVRKQDGVEEREQSLTLEMRNMPPGHTGWVYRTFAQGQDLVTYYRTLEFYLNRRIDPPDAEVEFFIRLAKDVNTDTTNYYEYRVPVSDGWHLIKVDLAELTRLKLEARDTTLYPEGYVEKKLPNGATLSLRGYPALTSVTRIALGVRVVGEKTVTSGNVWIDELRLSDVRRDMGFAGRFSLTARLSDFAEISFNTEKTDADFLRVGQTKGSGMTQTSTNFSTRVNLDRFISWSRLNLPLQLTMRRERRVPKYRLNSDIELGGLETDRDVSASSSRSLQLRVSRQRGDSHPLVRYTLDALSASWTSSWLGRGEPMTRDTTKTIQYSWSYNPPLGSIRGFRVYKNTFFNPLPTSFNVSSNYQRTETVRYRRIDSNLDLPYERVELTQPVQTSRSLAWGFGLRPLTPLSYTFGATRDLRLKEKSAFLGGINIGKEVSRSEQLSFSTSLRFLSFLLGPRVTPQFSWSGRSDLELNRPGSAGDSIGVRINNLRNSQTMNLSLRTPLRELLGRFVPSGKPKGRSEPGQGDTGKGTSPRTPRGGQRTPSGGGRPGGLGRLLKLGTLSSTYSRNVSTSYRRAVGMPSLEYRLGLSDDPGREVTQLAGATSNRTRSHGWNLSLDATLLGEIRLNTNYRRNATVMDQTGGANRTVQVTWPDLDIQWGQVHRLLGLQRFLGRSVRARTRYQVERSDSKTGTQGRDRTQLTRSWNPLLDFNTTLPNGMRVRLNSSLRSTETRERTPILNVTRTYNKQLSLDLSKSLTVTRNVKIPTSGETKRIKSRLDLALGVSYRSDKKEVQGRVQSDRATLEISAKTSYEFTRTIQGEGRISIGQDSDRINPTRTTRRVSVFLTASFSF